MCTLSQTDSNNLRTVVRMFYSSLAWRRIRFRTQINAFKHEWRFNFELADSQQSTPLLVLAASENRSSKRYTNKLNIYKNKYFHFLMMRILVNSLMCHIYCFLTASIDLLLLYQIFFWSVIKFAWQTANSLELWTLFQRLDTQIKHILLRWSSRLILIWCVIPNTSYSNCNTKW